jgi:hypothetical protein
MTLERREEGESNFAFHHALEWFKIHADQRMRLFNFYLLTLGGFVIISGTLVSNKLFIFETLAGGALIVISYCFRHLDCRISELIKVAESALNELELKYGKTNQLEYFNIIQRAEIKSGTLSYSRCFHILFGLGGVVGAVLFFHGLSSL